MAAYAEQTRFARGASELHPVSDVSPARDTGFSSQPGGFVNVAASAGAKVTDAGDSHRSNFRFENVFQDGSASIVPAATPQRQNQGAAIGSVVSVGEDSVVCELESDAGPVRVAFPRSHFPETARFGLPISISFQSIGGIRRPVIEERDATPKDDELTREIDELIAGL